MNRFSHLFLSKLSKMIFKHKSIEMILV